jgi:hypothetical protein
LPWVVRETQIETGLIGREGMIGMGIAIGDDDTSHELINQVEGDALAMEALDFRSALRLAPDLGVLAARFSRILGVQISHTALANAKFDLRQRLARWLLMAQDRVPRLSFAWTHKYLSIMLGVRRASITDTIHQRGLFHEPLSVEEVRSLTIRNPSNQKRATTVSKPERQRITNHSNPKLFYGM